MTTERTMSTVRWILLALVTLVAGYTVWTYWGPSADTHSGERADRYYCPMHPEIRSPDPGECPICHMTLEPIATDRQSGGAPGATPSDSSTPHGLTPITLSPEKERLISIATTPVTRSDVGQGLRVPGAVEIPEGALAQVRARAPGFVERVAVRQTGVRVVRGQPLAWIYSPDIYRAQEEFLAANRWAAGTPPSHAASASTDMARAARRSLELLGLSPADIDGIASSGTALREIPVRAPISGHITTFNAVLGMRADPDVALYEIADLSRMWVIASVYERDLPNIRVGMAALFAPAAEPDHPLAAQVDLVEPGVAEATRTARVRVVIPNGELKLRPGQYGDVTFDLPGVSALVVPKDAVIRTGEHEYVFVDRGESRFEPRLVRLGAQRGDVVQVLSGLSEGDRVVTRGNFMLDSESRLQASLAATSNGRSSPEENTR